MNRNGEFFLSQRISIRASRRRIKTKKILKLIVLIIILTAVSIGVFFGIKSIVDIFGEGAKTSETTAKINAETIDLFQRLCYNIVN